MNKAVYPGSFDPLSKGHIDIIERAAKIFDEVIVLISNNINKKYTFSAKERYLMLNKCLNKYPNVKVDIYDGLVVNYCKEHNINVMIRGLRNTLDFEQEYTLEQFNSKLNPNVETLVLFSRSENQIISSSAIRELIRFDADINDYIPFEIIEEVKSKIKG